jgi:hypothetical protein
MQTKIAVTVALCALFVAVPSATPKGGKPSPAGVQWSVICNEPSCAVGVTGLTPGPGVTYNLSVVDNCGTVAFNSNFDADSTGAFHTSVNVSAEDAGGCTTSMWTFTVSTVGRHSGPVSSTTINDAP